MARALTILLLVAAACGSRPERPPPEANMDVVYLNPGWTARQRQIYYYTPQGTELHGLRYDWFCALRMAGSDERFADPAHLASYGFLYDRRQFDPNYQPPAWNPCNLPVGFAYHVEEDSKHAYLGITCAACHTGQIEYGGRALRVDGGQAFHAFASLGRGHFIPTLLLSLQYTYANPFAFDRFARDVLGRRYPELKPKLRKALGDTLTKFMVEGYHSLTKGVYPTDEGPGRIDALDHIANTVFGDDLDPENYVVANAPVSYPHVWDTWKFDWVQWNGSVAQPMGRNVGEALGVKARLDLVKRSGKARKPKRMYDSSVLIRELHCIETTLWQLRPPVWDESILGKINLEKAAAGRTLFEDNCKHCHGPYRYATASERATAPKPYVVYKPPQPSPMKPLEWQLVVAQTTEVGTDPTVVDNFLGYTYDAGALDPGNPFLRNIDAGNALNYVTERVIARKYDELGLKDEERSVYDGFGRSLGVRPERGYKSRPLHGIWATPPFLHNGSVPTIYDMLLPEEERPRSFSLGSRQYDPVHLGYATDPSPHAFRFDTTLPGNANTGHQFRDDGGVGVIGRGLTDDERYKILEYLKVLGNPNPDYDPDYATVEQLADRETDADARARWAAMGRNARAACPVTLQGPPRHPAILPACFDDFGFERECKGS